MKKIKAKAGDTGLVLVLERSPGKGNGYPLQYSYLENPMGRGVWQAIQSMGLQSTGLSDWAHTQHTYQKSAHSVRIGLFFFFFNTVGMTM